MPAQPGRHHRRHRCRLGRESPWAGDGAAGTHDVVAVAAPAESWYSLALIREGIVHAWGDLNFFGSVAVPDEVVAITAGDSHSMALRADGSVFGLDGVISLAMSSCVRSSRLLRATGMALRAHGTVVAWGRNDFGLAEVPASLTNDVAIAARLSPPVALTASPLPARTQS